MGNVLSGLLLILILAIAIYGTVRRIRHGSSCCGEHEPAEKKIKVKDRNRDNYPYEYILKIDGMHCSNCAVRIENALNRGGDRWARADLGKKQVSLLSKREETENDLGTVVASAGYTLLTFERRT